MTGANFNGGTATTWAVNITTAATVNKVVARDASGDIYFRYGYSEYVNTSHASSARTSDTIFYSSTDNFIRKVDAASYRASFNVPTRTGGNASGTWGINITGSAASLTGATTAGSVGSYGFFSWWETGVHGPNTTVAGSSLRYVNTLTDYDREWKGGQNTAPGGSWRLMGAIGGTWTGANVFSNTTSTAYGVSLWFRYA